MTIADGGGLAGGLAAAVTSTTTVTSAAVASAAVASTATVMFSIFSSIGLVVAGATAYIHYTNLKANLETMAEAQVRREKELRELEVSRANLEAVLAQLSADSKSIVGSKVSLVPQELIFCYQG